MTTNTADIIGANGVTAVHTLAWAGVFPLASGHTIAIFALIDDLGKCLKKKIDSGNIGLI